MTQEGHTSLVRAAGAVTGATIISRILGLMREQVVAHLFGARWQTDAFNVAFRIPNLLRDLFAEGALSAAFVPTFTGVRTQRSPYEAWLLVNRVITLLVVVNSALALVVFLFARPIVLALASGFGEPQLALATQAARIMSPFLLFIALASILMGVLNTHGRFFVPALAPAAFNVASIACGILLSPVMPRFGLEPIVALAIGALLGALGQFAIQVPSAWRCGFRFRPLFEWRDPALARMLRLMLPAVVGLSMTQLSILVDTQFASHIGTGAVSYLNYAFRLVQLPIGLFGVSIATANLAAVSRRAAVEDLEGLKDDLARALRWAAFLTLPATAGLIALRTPIVRVLYQHGRFTAEDTSQTAHALLMYTAGLWAYALVKILVPTYYALGDAKVPVRSSMIALAMKIALNEPLTWMFGFAGLALSTSLGSLINLALLHRALRRRIGGLHGRGVGETTLRIAAASAAVALIAWATFDVATGILGEKLPAAAAALALAVAAGIGTLAVASKLLRVEEMGKILSRVLARPSGSTAGGPIP